MQRAQSKKKKERDFARRQTKCTASPTLATYLEVWIESYLLISGDNSRMGGKSEQHNNCVVAYYVQIIIKMRG